MSGGLIAILAVIAGGGGLLAWRSQRKRKARQAAEVAELHKVARDDLDAIGEDIRLLEIDVDMPGADPRAKERYGEAVLAYTRAEEGLDLARTSAAFQPIGQALEEGRFALAAAKAHLAGRDEPERRPPCFFDPRHGPSVTDVEWEPGVGGQARGAGLRGGRRPPRGRRGARQPPGDGRRRADAVLPGARLLRRLLRGRHVRRLRRVPARHPVRLDDRAAAGAAATRSAAPTAVAASGAATSEAGTSAEATSAGGDFGG